MCLGRLVYVEFAAEGYDQFGRPYSTQPAQWRNILERGVAHLELDMLDIRPRIKRVWLSEHKNSLNLIFEFTSEYPVMVQRECDLLKQLVFTGAVQIGAPDEIVIMPDDASHVAPTMARRPQQDFVPLSRPNAA